MADSESILPSFPCRATQECRRYRASHFYLSLSAVSLSRQVVCRARDEGEVGGRGWSLPNVCHGSTARCARLFDCLTFPEERAVLGRAYLPAPRLHLKFLKCCLRRVRYRNAVSRTVQPQITGCLLERLAERANPAEHFISSTRGVRGLSE